MVAFPDLVVHHLGGSPTHLRGRGPVLRRDRRRPAACRTDRMGALGRSQGKRFELHAPTAGFGAHHGTKITSCQARDAKRKGKVERPFRQLQETFLPEVEADGAPVDLADLHGRSQVWLAERVHAASYGGRTRLPQSVAEGKVRHRLRGPRRVHNALPFVAIDANRYSVSPEALGNMVEIRRPVDSDSVEIRLAGRLIATHRLVAGRRSDVWDPAHKLAAEALALGWDPNAPDLRVVENQPEPAGVERLELGGDYDVASPDLDGRYTVTIDDGEVSV